MRDASVLEDSALTSRATIALKRHEAPAAIMVTVEEAKKMTVPKLKAELGKLGLSQSGQKAELLARLLTLPSVDSHDAQASPGGVAVAVPGVEIAVAEGHENSVESDERGVVLKLEDVPDPVPA